MSRKARRFGAGDQFTHRGMDAVRANHEVRINRLSVMESNFDPVRILRQPDASIIQVKYAVGQRCGQNFEQLGAMKMIVGSAEGSLAFVCQELAREDTAIVPTADLDGERSHSVLAQWLGESQPM